MPDLATLALFTAAAAGLLLVPGPSVLFVVGRTLQHGRRGGLISMLGVEAGALFHVAAATVGISTLVATSAVALLHARALLGRRSDVDGVAARPRLSQAASCSAGPATS